MFLSSVLRRLPIASARPAFLSLDTVVIATSPWLWPAARRCRASRGSKPSTTTLRPFGSRTRNYYEVLGLEPTCTQEEVREAYVRLSKLYHPDANRVQDCGHAEFAELNEAYSVLGRPSERKLYDENLRYQFQYRPHGSNVRGPYARREGPVVFTERTGIRRDPAFSRRFRSTDRHLKPYVVLGCLLLMFGGCLMHYLAYRYGRSYNMMQGVAERSQKYAEIHRRAVEDHRKYGTEGQLRRIFGERYENGDGTDGAKPS